MWPVIAVIAAGLAAALGFVVLSTTFEREVLAPAARDVQRVLSPGVLVLGLVGLFLILRARR